MAFGFAVAGCRLVHVLAIDCVFADGLFPGRRFADLTLTTQHTAPNVSTGRYLPGCGFPLFASRGSGGEQNNIVENEVTSRVSFRRDSRQSTQGPTGMHDQGASGVLVRLTKKKW